MDVRRAFGVVCCSSAGLAVGLMLIAFLDWSLSGAGAGLPLFVWAACSAAASGAALLVALVVDAEREATYGGWMLTLAGTAVLVLGVVGLGMVVGA